MDSLIIDDTARTAWRVEKNRETERQRVSKGHPTDGEKAANH